jgi:hypothetical protein
MKNIPITLIGVLFALLLSLSNLYSQELEASLFDEVNQSMRMANLSQADVDQSRFSTKGFGESRPVANNETLAGRKLNRHIDIVIKPTFQEVLSGSAVSDFE